jgi:hypothetical protein
MEIAVFVALAVALIFKPNKRQRPPYDPAPAAAVYGASCARQPEIRA